MRRFAIVVIITCLLSIALFFYVEHDTRKFIQTIAPPVSTAVQQKTQTQDKADPQAKEETDWVDPQDPQGIIDRGIHAQMIIKLIRPIYTETQHIHTFIHRSITIRNPTEFHLFRKPNPKQRTTI